MKTLMLNLLFLTCALSITTAYAAETPVAPTAAPTVFNPGFKNFKGPKAGTWLLDTSIALMGAKKIKKEKAETCIAGGEDLTKKATGKYTKLEKCEIRIMKDTELAGALIATCGPLVANIETTKLTDVDYKLSVKSTMADLTTNAKWVRPCDGASTN